MPSSPATQKLVMDLAREALTSLLKTDMQPRVALFSEKHSRPGPGEKRQGGVLNRLERAGVITGIRNARNPIIWGINDTKQVRELLDSPEKLSAVLWPASQPTLPDDDLGEDEAPTEEPAAEAAPQPDVTQTQMLEALLQTLKVMKTIGDSVAQLHERMAAIDKLMFAQAMALGNTEKQLANLTAFVSPRMGEAEALQLKAGDVVNYHNGSGLVEVVKVAEVVRPVGRPVVISIVRPGHNPVSVTPKYLSRRVA